MEALRRTESVRSKFRTNFMGEALRPDLEGQWVFGIKKVGPQLSEQIFQVYARHVAGYGSWSLQIGREKLWGRWWE